MSAGCHLLLRDYAAVCVSSPAHARELVFGAEPSESTGQLSRDAPEHQRVRDALETQARSLEHLAAQAGLSPVEVAGVLIELELAGVAQNLDGGWKRARLNR